MVKLHMIGCLVLVTAGGPVATGSDTIPLWPQGHAALDGLDENNLPMLNIYQASPGIRAANLILLVCPGGGYGGLTMGDEGHSVAAWYAQQGITAAVLKYRLPKKGKWSPEKDYSTLRDAQRAVQVMRYRSTDLGMVEAKVGILGFSAGGHLACMTATRWRNGNAAARDPIEKISARPDFACLIYPVVSFMDHGHGGSCVNLLGASSSEAIRKKYSGEFNVSKDMPPIFMVHANNDGVKPENSVAFYQTMRKLGMPVELHVVSRGGHGFFDHQGWGIPGKPELRFSRAGAMWPIWTLNWMLEEKLVGKTWQWPQRRRQMTSMIDPSKRNSTKASLPTIISTWNHGIPANAEAMKILKSGGSVLDAVEQALMVVESDPSGSSVGLGGRPDRDGIVTLDASIMGSDGNAGSVCFLQEIEHPIAVARRVMEKTPHVMLAGDGALQFALENGFKKRNLLTPQSEKAWKNWLKEADYDPVSNWENEHNTYHDTIGLMAVDQNGNLAGGCTTSGLAFKMHGRVGDSPVIGAGLYVDNEIGAATATGMGELVLKTLGSFLVVELMRNGRTPQEACHEAVLRIVNKDPENVKRQVGFIAVNKKGETGAFSLQPGFNYALYQDGENRMIDSPSHY